MTCAKCGYEYQGHDAVCPSRTEDKTLPGCKHGYIRSKCKTCTTEDRIAVLEAEVATPRALLLEDVVVELVSQFAIRSGTQLHTGGLSALKLAFGVLRMPDPCSMARFDELFCSGPAGDKP